MFKLALIWEKGVSKPSGSQLNSGGDFRGFLLSADQKAFDPAGAGGFKGNVGAKCAADGFFLVYVSACNAESCVG